MDALDLFLAVEADRSGRAEPRRLRRHLHLEKAPLAIAIVQMASEPFAIWGAWIGFDRENPIPIVSPEPRNANVAFQGMADLAEVLCERVERASTGPREDVHRKNREPWRRCMNAPQLLVANGAAVGLLERLGRRMRPAGYGGRVTVPERVNTGGAHLGFYAEAARKPGSALVIVATEALSHHWVTGQSSFENDHLGTQLAWHDPALIEALAPGLLEGRDPDALHGAEAADLVEPLPMGVLTDPEDDNSELADAVMAFNSKRAGATDRKTVDRLGKPVRALLEDKALRAQWEALWEARRLLAELQGAPGAERRWTDDRGDFTRHVDYISRGGRIASVDSIRRAVMVLSDWEAAQAALVRDEVLEDPRALAAAIVAGQAITGRVSDVDGNRKETNENGNTVTRPLVTLDLEEECPLPITTQVWWTDQPKLGAEIISVKPRKSAGVRVTLKVTAGMKGDLPEAGAQAAFTVFEGSGFRSAPLPKQNPWTHTADENAPKDGGADIDDAQPLDEVLDLTAGPV